MFCFKSVRGIIFDLDDTLVHAKLDFEKIKRAISCPVDADILSYIDSIENEDERRRAHERVIFYEMEDAQSSRLIEGAAEFIEQAKAHSLPLAIVTRNCRPATDLKLTSNQIQIDLVLTREDAAPKPSPDALLQIAQAWQIKPAHLAYIGDYIYDIEAAHNAQMQAWLFSYDNAATCYSSQLRQIAPRQ